MFQNPLPLSVTKNSSPASLTALDDKWLVWNYNGQESQYVQKKILSLLIRVPQEINNSITKAIWTADKKGPIKQQCIIQQVKNKAPYFLKKGMYTYHGKGLN